MIRAFLTFAIIAVSASAGHVPLMAADKVRISVSSLELQQLVHL